jgi:hypothetical protein
MKKTPADLHETAAKVKGQSSNRCFYGLYTFLRRPERAWSLIQNEKPIVLFYRNCHVTKKSKAMCKEMLVILVNRVVVTKRIFGTNGGPRRRRGTRGC